MTTPIRFIANLLMATLMLFLLHRYLMFWQTWPDLSTSFAQLFNAQEDTQASSPSRWQAMAVVLSYTLIIALAIWQSLGKSSQSLMDDSDRYARWSAAIIRFAFWSVFLIGLIDATISFLRIEGFLEPLVGKNLDSKLGQAVFRGQYVHYPLLALSAVIAYFTKGLSFIWLAFLVVIAEFSIVITRFVFSYEQAYMGDLVRFWYAAIFLFSSAYTLIE
ncbi:MAG: hypothetical protein V3V09_03425, partial [Arenicellales bacterium]